MGLSDLTDLAAERALLGSLLVHPHGTDRATAVLEAVDFAQPSHAALYRALVARWRRGETFDPVLVAADLDPQDRETLDAPNGLLSLIVNAGGKAAVPGLSDLLADLGFRRRLLHAHDDVAPIIQDRTVPRAELLGRIRSGFDGIDPPNDDWQRPVGVDTFVAQSDQEDYDWIVPGVWERMDRTILVAAEGYGKTMLQRQVATLSAQGIHPLTFQAMPPIRTLIVDLENPERLIRRTLAPIIAATRKARITTYLDDEAALWARPGGIDVRTDTGYRELDRVFGACKPDLVCIGPLYKLFRKRSSENDEDAAAGAQAALDDLRTRHRCALLIEHHAPKEQAGHRAMIPFGSSLWQRWPEFGPALVAAERGKRDVLLWSEWRPGRDVRQWPEKLIRGSTWPWEAVYPTGTF